MEGSAGLIGAGLFNVEIGSYSLVGYGYFHREGVVDDVRGSGSRFFGVSGAWTPIDNMETGHVLSFQLGLSHETSTRERLADVPMPGAEGHAVLLHPTVTIGVNKKVLLFALTSIPVSQRWQTPSDEQQFRVGFGTIYTFGQ